MRAVTIFLALFLISSLCPQHANSQTDSCSSYPVAAVQNQFQFNTSSLHCNAVWTPHNYILRYGQASSDVWSFLLSGPNANSYVGIGFSPNGQMVGSSAIVGWVDSSGTGGVKPYYLGGTSSGQVEVNKGDLVIVGNSTSVVAVGSTIYIGFQLTTTSLPGNLLIYALGPTGVIPSSSSSYQLTEHQDMTTTSINYVSGQSQTIKTPYATLKKNHGILNMVGWGILVVIGAIVARHCKEWDPIWFYSHIAIQTVGFILGVAGFATGLVLEDKLGVSTVDRHKGIGIFILVLGCLQMMAALARPGKTSKYRKYWNWYHHNVGRVLIIFAAANVFYGIHLGAAGRSWNIGYAIVLIVLFIAIIVLEIRMLMRKRNGK